jgi:hypothetical protein
MRPPALIALFMLWATGPVMAADPPPIPIPPELRAFLTEPHEQDVVKGQALRDWNNIVANCGAPTLEGANVVIGVLPAFDKAGKPVSGNWRVVTRLAGCGQTRTFNLLYAFGKNGQILRIGMLPGSSAADPILQRDALVYANLAMGRLAPPNCKEFKYLDTAFEAFGAPGTNVPPGREARSWTEKWTVSACGVTGLVKLYFTPDAAGTAISTKLDETIKVTPK